MSNKFNIEIITPENQLLKAETSEAIIPSYEGQMGILKDHIPIITFLRPGMIIIKDDNEKKFFVEDGTVEFSNNNLLILTSTAKNISKFDKNSIDKLILESEKKLEESEISDKEKYNLSHKIQTLREIN